ncbi:carbon storage regulator [Aureliella helgolandensis]|uniref:Translational regulator CsrA n=1 Tax=Aureliella helgolandensis TaxID=2527968 RepID=A0A518G5T9_9BACT|nr:carbon storage regulator [Aureliella helgolandensis]QDV23957.1 Carbon storage regulator [Aureliella helgolandensis]
MLILSRRAAECICLGDDIVLTIVAVGNDKVRIGVKAPPGVRILRNELEIQVEPGETLLPFASPGQAEKRSEPASDATSAMAAAKVPGGSTLRGFINSRRQAA